MKELDLLKQHWRKNEESLPHLSYDQIYKMIWKRSSSIVKWIFIISILELLLSTMLSIFLADEEYWNRMEKMHLKNFSIGLYIVSYLITFFFVWKFYINYRKISATDDAATRMENILITRSTVKNYIWYVLISSGVTSLIYAYYTLEYHVAVQQIEETAKYTFDSADWVKFVVAGFLILSLFLLVIWFFYRLIYGILLRRLKRNYKALKDLEF